MPSAWGAIKPPAGTALAWGHPLTKGLLMCFPFNEGPGMWSSVTGMPHKKSVVEVGTFPWFSGGAAVRGRPSGRGVRNILATNKVLIADVALVPLPVGPCTVALGYRKTDATLRDSYAFGVDDVDVITRLNVHLPYVDGVVYFDYGGIGAGTTRVSVSGLAFGSNFWVFSTGPRGMEIWQDGALRASNTANPTRRNDAGTGLYIGGMDAIPFTDGDLAEYSYFAMWGRQLSRQDIVALSGEPYSLFAPSAPYKRGALPAAAADGSYAFIM